MNTYEFYYKKKPTPGELSSRGDLDILMTQLISRDDVVGFCDLIMNNSTIELYPNAILTLACSKNSVNIIKCMIKKLHVNTNGIKNEEIIKYLTEHGLLG